MRQSVRQAVLVLLVAAAPFVLTVTVREPALPGPSSAMPPGALGILTGPDGVEITGVLPGSPAEIAGLRPGDRILAVGGLVVGDPEGLRRMLLARRAGERIAIRVARHGESVDVAVVMPHTAER
jgi:S1-C subfamily serine protease